MDQANAVAVDSGGNVIVVGSEETFANGKDWKIIKYDSAGNLLYQASYNAPLNRDDVANGVAVDSAGNIWVVGYETAWEPVWSYEHYDWRVRKYSPDLSTVLVDFSYDYEPPPFDSSVDGYWMDQARGVAVDSGDNVIIAGYVSAWGDPATAGIDNNYNWLIRKFDSTGGFIWEQFFDWAGADDIACSVAVDSTDSILIGGSMTTGFDGVPFFDWTVVKLDPGGGFVTFTQVGGASGWYVAKSVAVNKADDSVYVAGFQDPGRSGNSDWLVIKYPSSLGAPDWQFSYNGAFSVMDEAMGIGVNANGDVIVGGFADDTGVQAWVAKKLKGLDGSLIWSMPFGAGSSPTEFMGGVAVVSNTRVIGVGMQATDGGDWHTMAISEPACVETAVSVTPGQVCLGGNLEIVLTASNTGVSAANAVSATLSIDVGEATVSLISGPAGPVAIAPGAMQNFTWAFSSVAGGVLGFTVTAMGTDSETAFGILVPLTGLSATVTQSAVLSSVMTVNPLNVLVGNNFEAVLNVSNTGGSDAVGVEATMWVDSGGSLITFVSGPATGPYTISAGGSAQFTWTWAASGNGLAGFTATVTGADACGGTEVSSGASGSITIPGALLEAALRGIPNPTCPGGIIDVHFTVTNIGSGSATGVSATLSVDVGESLLTLISANSAPVDIGPSSAFTFTWTYGVSGTPQVAFTATATGLDPGTGLTVTTPVTAPPIPILPPANLEGAVSVMPSISPFLPGNIFEVVLTVTNTGGITATAVAATMWFDAGGTPADFSTGPAGPVDIPAGGSQYFTWIWLSSAEGLIALSASATGIDLCRGLSVTAYGTGSVLVSGPGRLVASLGVEPPTAVAGSPVDLILTVTNTGVTDVANLTVTVWVDIGKSRVQLSAEPVGLAILAGGASAKFTWTFNTLAMGLVRFSATASGTETIAGTFVSASAYADLILFSKGILSAQLTMTPATVVSGGTVRAVARVWNSAPAGSLAVLDVEHIPPPHAACPAVPRLDSVLSGSATVAEVLRPAAGCTSLIVGASAWYTWTFTASGAGNVDFTVSFTGIQDASPVEEVYAVAVRRLSIVAPASLSATLTVNPDCGYPCGVNYGDTIKVRLEVGNTSGSAAANVHPLTLTVTGTALSPVSAPSGNRFIPGFSTYSFEWTYLVSGSGSVTVYCQAAGSEFTLLTPLWSNSSSIWIGIPAPAAVTVAVTGPDSVVIGQDITLPVSLTNISATSIIQTGFQVTWNGSSAGVILVSTDPTLPRSMAPGTTRNFQLVVRLDTKAEVGNGILEIRVVATEQYTSKAVESLGGRLALELVPVSESNPTGALISSNPWKPSLGDLEVRYVVSAPAAGGTVSVKVYTLGGDLVRTLVNEARPEGSYTARWNGRNSGGQKVARGVYLLLVETKSGKRLQKLAVIK